MSKFNGIEEEIGKAVAMTVFNTPLYALFPQSSKILIIKRPPDDNWEPNKYSIPVGHIENKDVETLRKYPVTNKTKELLYVIAGLRELKEEVKTHSSASFLEYVGTYYDHKTNYDVIVLMGYMCRPGVKTIKDLKDRTPVVGTTKEAVEVCWKSIDEIKKLIEKDEFAGEKTIKMCLDCLYSRIY
jgi:8-oxo-dGTP pyrophosphatase MutT (NUDIX family)